MNQNILRCMVMLGGFCLFANIAWADAAEPMPMPMPVPTIPTSFLVLVMLGLMLDVILLAAVVYLWMMWRQDHQALRQISELSSDLKEFGKALQELQQPIVNNIEDVDELPDPEIPLAPIKKEVVWKTFVEEFNQLAANMKTVGASETCEKFVAGKKITLLMCLDPAAELNGQPSPKFVAVKSVPVSAFWAWPLPGVADRYAVVPNPSIPYEKKIHEEGGMKETFASNFETGICRKIEVRMPALFQNVNGNWIIDQPGIIHVEP